VEWWMNNLGINFFDPCCNAAEHPFFKALPWQLFGSSELKARLSSVSSSICLLQKRDALKYRRD
jgi:hypothetical protein